MNSQVLSGKSTLIVDDEAPFRESLTEKIAQFQGKVIEAKNGQEAMSIVRQKRVDLIISDLRMKYGSGLELLAEIKAHNRERPIVILISGFTDIPVWDIYDRGAEAYWGKPFNLTAFVEHLTQLMTSPESRWSKPSPQARQTISIQETSDPTSYARLGRGGMVIGKYQGPLQRGALVNFSVPVQGSSENFILNGTGVVRWTREAGIQGLNYGCGIEFLSLSESSISNALNYISEHNPLAYIPRKI